MKIVMIYYLIKIIKIYYWNRILPLGRLLWMMEGVLPLSSLI